MISLMTKRSFSHTLAALIVLGSGFVQLGSSILPEVSQEGLLRPYRSYADVTLFHYFVPKEVVQATFEFKVFMDNSNCPDRDVYIFLQHGSYPVMSPDESKYPPNLWVSRTSMVNLTLHTAMDPRNVTTVYNPLPGSWFAAAYLPNWDQHVQQEGIGHKCLYSLGSIALWSQQSNMDTVPIGKTTRVKNMERFTYHRFFIPTGTWGFNLKVDGCEKLSPRRSSLQELISSSSRLSGHFRDNLSGSNSNASYNRTGGEVFGDSSSCLQSVLVQGRRLPTFSSNHSASLGKDSVLWFNVSLPYTEAYYYILTVSESKVAYNITISFQECPMQVLGKSFVQQFAGLTPPNTGKQQAVRTNVTKMGQQFENGHCKCALIFRLTRIKHAQDFSNTFLLEGKDWFTSWLALTDTRQVGVSLEILPYLDNGGTLSIGIHLDEYLLNATNQIVTVTGCVGKAKPPGTFCCIETNISDCCESGLTLHISSEGLSKVDDTVLVPFPEPDNWIISFTTKCYSNRITVPCAMEEVLISLDIRTQPCSLTKPISTNGPILPCGPYGVCQEVHKGLFFFTSCRCIGGYRGWACSDDEEATPNSVLLVMTLMLTLSNLFFVPAIVLAIRRRMFTHVIIYFSTMIASTLYHACDQDVYGYCLTRYQVLQFCDFFCSILAFWVTLIALARSHPKVESALYMVGAILIAIGVEYNRTGLLVFIVPFSLGVGFPLGSYIYRSLKRREESTCKVNWGYVIVFLPGMFLGAAGLVLFAFVETEDNYPYTHSAWHAIIALSLVYLLPKLPEVPPPESETTSNERIEVSNSAELTSVAEQTANHVVEPVFILTSEFDHLVQEPPR